MPSIHFFRGGRYGGAIVIAIIIDGAVVGRKDHHRVFAQSQIIQGFENFTGHPIELHHGIASIPQLGLSLETRIGRTRHMYALRTKIKKEWFVLIGEQVGSGLLHKHIRHRFIVPKR